MNIHNKDTAIKNKRDYDLLNMLNSISNFEIFTPFSIAQNMIALLPIEIFKKPEYKFLDPCVKSGIFLREIIYKLDEHLPRIKYKDIDSNTVYDLSIKQERINHILKNMIYGIAISELTSYVTRRTIYGVMDANVDKAKEYLDSKILRNKSDIDQSEDLYFNDYYNYNMFNTIDRKGYEKEGNIFYPNKETTIETEDFFHPFINTTSHKFINQIKEEKMKFDVIIGNPPYQKQDGGGNSGMSATPLYNIFVNQAINLKPKYILMIIPSRWFSGGKGLSPFREQMLNDKRISHLVDFEKSTDVFSGVPVAGGICYFLWEKKYSGKCQITNKTKTEEFTSTRNLNEFHILVRHSKSIPIINKVLKAENNIYLDKIVSARKPFGINSNEKPDIDGIPCWFAQKIGKKPIIKNKIIDEREILNKWKVLIPFAPIAGQTDFSNPIKFYNTNNVKIAAPGEVCSETYLVANSFNTLLEAENFSSYIFTKLFRFLLLQNVVSQNVTRSCFFFVPNLINYNNKITDDFLKEKWKITEEEWEFICKKIV